ESATGPACHRAEHGLKHLQPLLGREQRLLAGMDADGDDQAVAQTDRLADDIQMAVRDRIERAGIERGARHAPLYLGCRDLASRAGSAPQGIFISRPASNYLRKFGVFLSDGRFILEGPDETKLRWDETILVQREDVPKRRTGIQPLSKRRAEQGPKQRTV